MVSNYPRNIDRKSISVWKFVHKCTKFGCTRHSRNKFRSALIGTNSLATDIQRIKRICAVGAVFEEVFFTLGKFLAAFVLAETVAAAAYAGCLNGEDKVVVILSVEEWHKALLAGKTLVDEKIFLIVPHGIAEIDRLDSPAVAFKLMNYHPTEELFVDGIV